MESTSTTLLRDIRLPGITLSMQLNSISLSNPRYWAILSFLIELDMIFWQNLVVRFWDTFLIMRKNWKCWAIVTNNWIIEWTYLYNTSKNILSSLLLVLLIYIIVIILKRIRFVTLKIIKKKRTEIFLLKKKSNTQYF